MLRNGSRFWLVAQLCVVVVVVAGTIVFSARFEFEQRKSAHARWADIALLVFLPCSIMAAWTVFIGRAIQLRKPRWARRAWWRRRRGCCPGCGYELRWQFERGCPECGWKRLALAVQKK